MVVAFMPYPVSKWHSLPPQPRYSLNPVSPDAIFGDTSTGGLCGAFHKYLEARFLRDVSGAMKEIKEKERREDKSIEITDLDSVENIPASVSKR